MKKIAGLLIVIGIASFWFFSGNENEETEVLDEVAVTKKQNFKKIKTIKKKFVGTDHEEEHSKTSLHKEEESAADEDNEFLKDVPKDRPLTDDEIRAIDDYFDKAEEEWENSMKRLISEDMGLNAEAFATYEKMKDSYEQDRIAAIDEFNEELEEKYGESYRFEPGPEIEKFENKIRDQYAEKLKALFGEDNYTRYLELKKDFNDKLEEEQDPDRGFIQMEI